MLWECRIKVLRKHCLNLPVYLRWSKLLHYLLMCETLNYSFNQTERRERTFYCAFANVSFWNNEPTFLNLSLFFTPAWERWNNSTSRFITAAVQVTKAQNCHWEYVKTPTLPQILPSKHMKVICLRFLKTGHCRSCQA